MNVQEDIRSLAQTSLCRRYGLLGNSRMGVAYGSSGSLRDLFGRGGLIIHHHQMASDPSQG